LIVPPTALQKASLSRTAASVAPRAGRLLAVALITFAASFLASGTPERLVLMAVTATLVCLVLLIRGLSWRRSRIARGDLRRVTEIVAQDAAPCFTTDEDGAICYQNDAAQKRFGERDGQSLVAALGDLFATPSAVLYRLQSRAAKLGAGREDVLTKRGHVRLSVHRAGQGRFLWRLEEMLEREGPGRGAEGLSLPMLIASKTGTVLFANEAVRRLLGGRPRALDRVFTTLPVRSGEEMAVTGPDGPVRALVAEIAGPGDRREIYLLPTLHNSGAEAQSGFEDLPVALMRLAPDGTVLSINRLARDLLALAPETAVRLPELVEGLGRPVADWLSDVMAERTPGRPEVLRARRSDQDVYLQITLRRIVEHGQAGLLAVLNDATELKTLEAQFVQSQKMQAIGQLAGGVAHDFNNLLTAISGHCDLLLLRHERSDPEYADLVQIHQNANRAASLVGQLLAFSRKQTLKPEIVDLREALSDLTHLLNRLVGERVTLQLCHDPDLGPIRTDKRQLEQVLMNLVVNARDAMPEGGTIRIETAATHLAQELHRDRAVVPVGDYAVVRVRDQGHGIPADKLTKIFEPFFTTKRTGEGTGLGLSTAYGIVKQTGGFIFVDSTPGAGSTFSLYFPIHTGPLSDGLIAEAPPPPRPTPRQGEGVVLLVEDEAPVRAFASRALRLRGYTVLEAGNAEEALKTLEDADLSVDVFVTDVIMPGMDGPSWVRQALEARPGVRVVFISGYAEDAFADTQARIPNSVFLPKPFSLNDLTTTVQRQIH
jgi:two-component system, cell cycle sensor histidine kinase and response regulator CckA